MKKIILLLFGIAIAISSFSQEYEITGKITKETGEVVQGATVTIKGTNISTISDVDGKYKLNVRDNDILIVTYMGLTPEEVVVASLTQVIVGKSNVVDIVMKEEFNIFDMSLEELMSLKVTTVSKKEETITETPQTVIVVTKEDLQKRGYTDIEQVFHDLPGFDISRGTGTEYSNIYQRGYRSNNTNRTLLLVDGVEENDLWSNSAWISLQHSLSNIERIEVIYGPASTVYGPNAFLGVVNIITKDAETIISDNKHFGINAQGVYGSWNSWYSDITAATKIKDFSLVLTSRFYQSEMQDMSNYDDWDYDLNDYDLNYYKEILGIEDDALAQLAKDYDMQGYYNDPVLDGIPPQYSNDKKDWYVNAKVEISDFTFGTQFYRNIEGYGTWYRDDYELGPKNGGSWGPLNSFAYAKYDKKLGTKLTLTSTSTFKVHQLKGNSNEEFYYTGYLNGGLGLSNLLETSDSTFTWNTDTQQLDTSVSTSDPNPYWWHAWYNTYSEQFRTEVKLLMNFNEKFSVVSGLEYRRSHIQGNYIYGYTDAPEETANPVIVPGGNHFAIMDIGFFTQANYYIMDNLNLVLGARADYNKSRVTGGYGMVFNPKAALVFTPGNFIMKVIYSEAIKDATSWDKYGTTPGRLLNNPELEPEKVKNTEFSAGWKINSNMYLDIAMYNANYSNVIGTADVSFVNESGETVETTQHQAIGQFQIQGAQSTFTYKYGNYSAYANYTFTNPISIQEDGSEIRIGDISSHRANVGVNAIFIRKLNVNLRANWVGERLTGAETTISSNPVNSVDAYFTLNGAITYNIYKDIFAQISVFNILDSEYFHPGVRSANGGYYASVMPQLGRSIMGKIYLNF